jgi:peroxiredoxin
MRAKASETDTTLGLGDTAPNFTLPGTDGADHAFALGEVASVVIFTCNHCPYALAWEERLLHVGAEYRNLGVRFFAINSNDAVLKPADSFENMKLRTEQTCWPFPYLRDESQEVARAYGALTTPDVFVFDSDGKLAYRGAPDADYENESLAAAWLRDALDALIAGEAPRLAETESVGCSVKWAG